MAKKASTRRAITGTAPVAPIVNAALPTSTGTYRVMPTYQPWSSKQLETMAKSRDRVQISRFLQEKIPVLSYCITTLPKEAVGKGIGLKSTSADPAFKAAATAYYKAWADSRAVDLRKEGTAYELQARWLSTILGDGECFVQKVADNSDLTQGWTLTDKNRRRLQLQTILRDQLTSSGITREEAKASRWIDGLQYNPLDQLINLRVITGDTTPGTTPSTLLVNAANVFHLKQNRRFNQCHGDPFIFQSNEDLLDVLDLKAIRKHAAKIRSALLGATTTRDGKVPNAMQQAMAAEMTGNPATDTGKRFMEIADGAVMIPLQDGETMTFFQGGEGIPFKEILEQLTHPFIFGLGYPVEWIFGMGTLGGTAFRGIIEKVRRAHENLRALLYPFLQWTWEWVIADAMMPGGALAKFAAITDWNEIDFVTDPDPSVDLGRDHKADMDRYGENLLTAEDYVESRTGGSGTTVRESAILEKLHNIRFAIHHATGKPLDQIQVPESIALIIGLGHRASQAASGLVSSLTPEALAAELTARDQPA